jgi:hypothetical protein
MAAPPPDAITAPPLGGGHHPRVDAGAVLADRHRSSLSGAEATINPRKFMPGNILPGDLTLDLISSIHTIEM